MVGRKRTMRWWRAWSAAVVVVGWAARTADPACDQAPDCPDKVKWSTGSAIEATLVSDKAAISAWRENHPLDCMVANLTATVSDCDNWECCGGCPAGGSGSITAMVMCSWSLDSGPTGYELGTNCWLEGTEGCTATFKATLPGSYSLKMRADDGGYADECGGSNDDDYVDKYVGLTVGAWEAGPAPTVGIQMEQYVEGMGFVQIPCGSTLAPGTALKFATKDWHDDDFCPTGSCTLEDCNHCDSAPWRVMRFNEDTQSWEQLGDPFIGCGFEWTTPCDHANYRVDVDVSDCGDGYDDEEDAHGECSFFNCATCE